MNNQVDDTADVVVPFYNRSDFLLRLLDSVAVQSFPVSKIYIVDNGSRLADSEKAWHIICQHRLSEKCCFISTTKTGNANYARNLGYGLSQACYVAYLDSDDWWENSHLANSVELLKKTGKSGCYSGAILHQEEGAALHNSIDIEKIGCPFKFLFGGVFGSAQTSSFVISKRSVGELVKWDELLKRSQDHDYFLSLQLNTNGWVYKSLPEYHIDWSRGGTKGKVDSFSILHFYRKWETRFPFSVVDRFFIRNLLAFELRGMIEDQNFLKREYINVLSKIPKLLKTILVARPSLFVLGVFMKIKTRFNGSFFRRQ
jgi:glycosyltransferase involved in cell wall biosynthesis